MVLSLVGPHAGVFAGGDAPLFSHLLPEGWPRASVTQWEVFFGQHLSKPVTYIGRKSLFDSFKDNCPVDETQKAFIKNIKKSGRTWDCFDQKTEIPDIALKRARDLRKHPQGERQSCGNGIDIHLDKLRQFSLTRLSKFAVLDEVYQDYDKIIQHFAHRYGEIAGRKISLISATTEAVRARARPERQPMQQFLIVARAGEGKTTLIHLLILSELAKNSFVKKTKIVPILADCVTIARLMVASGEATTDKDREAIRRWLTIAVAPNPDGRLESTGQHTYVNEFLNDLRKEQFELLIVIDGLDELEPSGTSVKRIERFLNALDNWAREEGLTYSKIATTRPNDGDDLNQDERIVLAKERGFLPVTFWEDDGREIRRLGGTLLPQASKKMLAQFVKVFQGNAIKSKFVYLRPLALFFKEHPKDALTGNISSIRLLENECKHVVNRLCDMLRERHSEDFDRPDITINHILLNIALLSLNQFDQELPQNLSKRKLMELPSVERVTCLSNIMNEQTLVSRLLHVLIYVSRDDKDPTNAFYRLPHNEYRDYLLADGIFRWIYQDSAQIEQEGKEFIANLACSYQGAARVGPFMAEIMKARLDSVTNPKQNDFACKLVEKMNNKLLNRKPSERTDASPHGAMLSLLLRCPGLSSQIGKVKAAGKCFQGARVPIKSGTQRYPIHIDKNARNVDFTEANLSGADLAEIDFTGAIFDNAIMNGASLKKANFTNAILRNVQMGKFVNNDQSGLPTDLSGAVFENSDWFNYRFPGLSGYFHFWDIEGVKRKGAGDKEIVLVSGSRGQLLAFDPLQPGYDLTSRTLQTDHNDEILDISRHPKMELIVTTSRDCNVLLYEAPELSVRDEDERSEEAVRLKEWGETRLSVPFSGSNYPRRALFSKSGRWLSVIARDPRVAFYQIDPLVRPVGAPVFGQGHTGPVMCLVADSVHYYGNNGPEPDICFSAGYDGRLSVWREGLDKGEAGWLYPAAISSKPEKAGKKTEIFRALAINEDTKAVWAGTELESRLMLFRYHNNEIQMFQCEHFDTNGGVFSLAILEEPSRIAVGFANGRVKVLAAKNMGYPDRYDWENPMLDQETNGEIIRSLHFFDKGRQLLAATWDACLYRFNIEDGTCTGRFEYPNSMWRPKCDTDRICFGTDENPLTGAKGISDRMKSYLRMVNQGAEVI